MARIERFAGEPPATAEPRERPAPAAHAEQSPEPLPLLEYLGAVRLHRWSILGLVVLGALIGVLVGATSVPLYKAQARLLVKQSQPTISGMQQFESAPAMWTFRQTLTDVIVSQAIAERVVDRLGLAAPAPAPAGAGAGGTLARIESLLPAWREWIPEELAPAPTSARAALADPRSAAVARVIGGLDVVSSQGSEVVAIGFTSTEPAETAAVANAVAEAYIDFRLESRLSTASQATSWLGQRLEELRDKLDVSERALSAFQSQEGMVDTASRESIISARLGTLSAELIRAQTRSGETESRRAQFAAAAKKGDATAVLGSSLDAMLLDAHRNREQLRRRVAELAERYGEKHPKMIAARADEQEASQLLREEIARAAERARREHDVAKAHEAEIRRLIDRQQEQMRALSAKAFELAKLEREVEANRRLHEAFLGRFKEADVAEDFDLSNVRIIDRAHAPAAPFKPDRGRIIAGTAALGLLLGVLLALLRHHLDRTFKCGEDIQAHLHLPLLGMLEKLSGGWLGTRLPERHVLVAPRSPFSESVNDIRTALLFSRVDDPPRSLLVTSALPGEGKTTVASNLALAFARRGRTLLIDSDLRRGRVGKLSRTGGRAGLTDVVSGEATVEDAVMPDAEAPDLFLMTAGTLPPNPLEVLSSSRFANRLARLHEEFDYIVVDGSPLLAVSDSVVLAHLVDGVVLVVQADKTDHATAREAARRLQSSGVSPLGAVLQQIDGKKLRGYSYRYGYKSGYHYSYGAREGSGR